MTVFLSDLKSINLFASPKISTVCFALWALTDADSIAALDAISCSTTFPVASKIL